MILYRVFGFIVEDKASFKDREGYMDFEGLSKQLALQQSVLLISERTRGKTPHCQRLCWPSKSYQRLSADAPEDLILDRRTRLTHS